jgi:hypothetical protein
VGTGAEREVLVRRPHDVEPIGGFEDRGVAIRRRHPHRNRLSRIDRLASAGVREADQAHPIRSWFR